MPDAHPVYSGADALVCPRGGCDYETPALVEPLGGADRRYGALHCPECPPGTIDSKRREAYYQKSVHVARSARRPILEPEDDFLYPRRMARRVR